MRGEEGRGGEGGREGGGKGGREGGRGGEGGIMRCDENWIYRQIILHCTHDSLHTNVTDASLLPLVFHLQMHSNTKQ